MVDGRSDDELRRIVFGRGSSDRDVADASAELERRSAYRVPDAEPASTDRVAHQDPHSGSPANEGASETVSVSRPSRRRGPTLVIGAAIAVLALAVGWGARGLLPDPAAPELPTGSPGVGLESRGFAGVTDPADGRILYTITRGELEDLGYIAQEPFPEAIGEQTALPGELGAVEASTARYLGQMGDLRGVWTARTSGGGYCLVLALAADDAYVSSCSPGKVFATDGVRISAGRYVLTWNARSLVLSLTSDRATGR